jgi:hypothetical protein
MLNQAADLARLADHALGRGPATTDGGAWLGIKNALPYAVSLASGLGLSEHYAAARFAAAWATAAYAVACGAVVVGLTAASAGYTWAALSRGARRKNARSRKRATTGTALAAQVVCVVLCVGLTSGRVHEHYLVVALPANFVLAAMAVDWLLRRGRAWVGWAALAWAALGAVAVLHAAACVHFQRQVRAAREADPAYGPPYGHKLAAVNAAGDRIQHGPAAQQGDRMARVATARPLRDNDATAYAFLARRAGLRVTGRDEDTGPARWQVVFLEHWQGEVAAPQDVIKLDERSRIARCGSVTVYAWTVENGNGAGQGR